MTKQKWLIVTLFLIGTVIYIIKIFSLKKEEIDIAGNPIIPKVNMSAHIIGSENIIEAYDSTVDIDKREWTSNGKFLDSARKITIHVGGEKSILLGLHIERKGVALYNTSKDFNFPSRDTITIDLPAPVYDPVCTLYHHYNFADTNSSVTEAVWRMDNNIPMGAGKNILYAFQDTGTHRITVYRRVRNPDVNVAPFSFNVLVNPPPPPIPPDKVLLDFLNLCLHSHSMPDILFSYINPRIFGKKPEVNCNIYNITTHKNMNYSHFSDFARDLFMTPQSFSRVESVQIIGHDNRGFVNNVNVTVR